MNENASVWTANERAIYRLRALYQGYGFSQYKMNKFEEYDLYVRNKDFLISDGIITFTDTNGKLLALKPDVTLSIVKNAKNRGACTEKVYYDENVYRVSDGTKSFKEIRQVGIECLGSVEEYEIYEVLLLACKSLALLSEECVLDISPFGILLQLLEKTGLNDFMKKAALDAIGSKNLHELKQILRECELSDAVLSLAKLSGSFESVIPALKKIMGDEESFAEIHRLETICKQLSSNGFGDMIRIDFSAVSDTDFYNGITFKGYVKGIPTRILSGGQYDRLLKKMGKNGKAVGFALYLDLLEKVNTIENPFDIDALVLYDESLSLMELDRVVKKISASGKSVMLQKGKPDKLRYRELYEVTESGVNLLERNA